MRLFYNSNHHQLHNERLRLIVQVNQPLIKGFSRSVIIKVGNENYKDAELMIMLIKVKIIACGSS